MKLRKLILNKKGDLMENALSLIIAVLGIALLIFAVWKLYDYMAGQDERNAQKTADLISDKIETLEGGQTTKFAIKGIEGWFLTGWGVDDASRPNRCLLNSCICICKGKVSITPRRSSTLIQKTLVEGGDFSVSFVADTCQKNGFCREIKTDKLKMDFFNMYMHELYPVEYSDEILTPSSILPLTDKLFPFLQFKANNLYEISLKKEIDADKKVNLIINPTS